MKPGKFDGTGSLESFLAQFDMCARHNRWSGADKVDFLRCSLEKAATQLLWDFGARADISYEQLVERLRQRYGAEGQAETFRAQLYYRQQRAGESLSDLLHDIRRLVVLAYPVPSNETTEIVTRDAFLEAIQVKGLALKVREREPKSIDEAYRMALRLAAYQLAANADERRRPQRVRGARENDSSELLQSQMEKFFAEQRRWQQDLEGRIKRQLDGLRETPNREDSTTTTNENERRGGVRGTGCFNCGRPGHFARNCRQRRRNGGTEAQPAELPPEPSTEAPARNNTTRVRPVGDTKNSIYLRCTINKRSTLCLVDTGSEVSLLPLDLAEGLTLQQTGRVLFAANSTEIRVSGEVSLPVKMNRGFQLETKFLVSDQVHEAMFGMDWLRQHRCRISFGTGAMYVGRRRFPFVKKDGAAWCRRITVAEEITLPPRSQCDVLCNLQCQGTETNSMAWLTEAPDVQPGVHFATVVLSDNHDIAQIRMVNLGDQAATLVADKIVSDLHPVEVEVRQEEENNHEASHDTGLAEELITGIADELNAEFKDRLKDLIHRYETIFSKDEHDLGSTHVTEHRIDTGDARPVRQPLRRQPAPYQAAIDQQLEQMLASGVVEPAVSEWAANVVLAKKKDGSLRFCIDYRKLNDVTKKDSYPLPRIDACLDALSGAGWFSTLDLRSGYHQVPLRPADADKTAFVTRRGTYRWRVMPFGLCNAPATFQRMMDIVLSGLNFELCLVYLDDVIIFSSNPEEHLDRLEQV